jgi:subtilisin family serine protease
VPKDPYEPPAHEHGTHVAGVLAGDWRTDDAQGPGDHSVQGVCPDMELYDLRVFDANGNGDEFAILAALQYVRWLNSNASAPVIHGVNLSLSLDHEVGAYACGRTPVCDECERLLGSGTVVVAAAGNEGRAFYSMASGTSEGYRQISITDPGNADGVITVGATHRHQPHTYGVSYFSSRGPTGDGRAKPDLVAPGEKITAPVPGGGLKSLDGTSQAAPHVSGAAALILARHPELIGQPAEIKRVLCETATDLGRERYFQGTGVVDVLRAIQSI